MKLLSPSPRQQTVSVSANRVDDFDPKTAGYIRLLSAVLEEPAESVAKALNVSDAIIEALALEKDQNAA